MWEEKLKHENLMQANVGLYNANCTFCTCTWSKADELREKLHTELWDENLL